MRVTLINHSDTRGGASVVTVRLMHALRQAGVDARLLVMHKSLPDNEISLVGSALTRKASFLLEHADIFVHNGFSRRDLFKASTAVAGLPLHRHPWVEDADVVVLNWINQGMLSLDGIARIKKPIVWTMHDMWCLTGVCHHAAECIGYLRECGNCRLAHHGRIADDMSRSTHRRKQKLYSTKPMHFVAVSNWLAEKCRQSSLMRGQQVSVIPNAFPVHEFTDVASRPRQAYGLPANRKLILMGAARLDDPIKGLDMAVDALNKITDTDATAVFFGALRDRNALSGLRLPHIWLGEISDGTTLHDIYAHSQCVLSSSHYETLPGTLVEGMAAGCVPVAFDHGGQSDIIDHLSTGYIARYHDTDDLADGLRYALSGKTDLSVMRRRVEERFAAEAVADKYIQLFNNILSS